MKTPEEYAQASILNNFGEKVYLYTVKNNPIWNRNKKRSAQWHNAFYDECKKLGRNPMKG